MTWASLHMAKQGSSVLFVILFAVGAFDLVLGTIIEVRHASGFASHEPTIWTWIFVGLAAALIACSLLFGQHIQTLSSVVAACVFLSVLVTRGNACSESAQPMTTPNKSSEQHSTDTPITCDLRPSVIAWPFHSVFTRPYVRIDEDVATHPGDVVQSRFRQADSSNPTRAFPTQQCLLAFLIAGFCINDWGRLMSRFLNPPSHISARVWGRLIRPHFVSMRCVLSPTPLHTTNLTIPPHLTNTLPPQ